MYTCLLLVDSTHAVLAHISSLCDHHRVGEREEEEEEDTREKPRSASPSNTEKDILVSRSY